MKTHNYIWKIGPQVYSDTTIRTNRPLTPDTILIDLYNGHKYLVQTIWPAKPSDKEWPSQPDTVIQTWPIGSISEDDLNKLRIKVQYAPDELAGPLGDVVFNPA
jgi:hypothetical protein